MADSYIYTLPEATSLSASDFTVVDVYDVGASGYVTKKASLSTVHGMLSANAWNSTYTTLKANSGFWRSSYTTLRANSGFWKSSYTTVNANSSFWKSSYTTVNANSGFWSSNNASSLLATYSANWESTYLTVKSASGSWAGGGGGAGGDFLTLIDAVPLSTINTTVTAADEFITVTIGGQPRAIQLWKY